MSEQLSLEDRKLLTIDHAISAIHNLIEKAYSLDYSDSEPITTEKMIALNCELDNAYKLNDFGHLELKFSRFTLEKKTYEPLLKKIVFPLITNCFSIAYRTSIILTGRRQLSLPVLAGI